MAPDAAEPLERFRARYRAEEVPASYPGARHAVITFGEALFGTLAR